jgi:hypothetical protein
MNVDRVAKERTPAGVGAAGPAPSHETIAGKKPLARAVNDNAMPIGRWAVFALPCLLAAGLGAALLWALAR